MSDTLKSLPDSQLFDKDPEKLELEDIDEFRRRIRRTVERFRAVRIQDTDSGPKEGEASPVDSSPKPKRRKRKSAPIVEEQHGEAPNVEHSSP